MISRKPRLKFRMRVVVSALALLTTSQAAEPAQPATFQWPSSSQYCRVIVNAQQGIESYPKEWFRQDTVVTDFTIADANKMGTDSAAKLYQSLRDLLLSYGLTVGTYISGTTVEPQAIETKYPWAVVPIEWMPPRSLYLGSVPDDARRTIIDVSDPVTRRGFQSAIKKLWEQNPASLRFIDNAAVHRSAGNGQPWANYCQNMNEIRQMGEEMGSVLIFNVPVHVGELSDAEADQLIEAVGRGGILLEMPWDQSIRRDPTATERARQRYRQLLDAGMAIIMAEPGPEPSQSLVQWVNTWRKPADHLYFAGAFWKQPDPNLYARTH